MIYTLRNKYTGQTFQAGEWDMREFTKYDWEVIAQFEQQITYSNEGVQQVLKSVPLPDLGQTQTVQNQPPTLKTEVAPEKKSDSDWLLAAGVALLAKLFFF